MRCGYTVICDELVSDGTKVNTLWARRQATKFNGVNYITQRAAEAVFTDEGQQQVKDVINYYRANAKVMVDAFKEMGVWFTGGENSPYIWHKVPERSRGRRHAGQRLRQKRRRLLPPYRVRYAGKDTGSHGAPQKAA